MTQRLSLFEQLLYTTVKLSAHGGGSPAGSGTGFFWTIQDGDNYSVFLITNQHVVVGCDAIEVVCHLAMKDDHSRPSGHFENIRLDLRRCPVVFHPDVDLCCILFTDAAIQHAQSGQPLFYRTLGAAIIPTEEIWDTFDAIEEVLMIGCPRGIYDEANNFPIVRRGITATSVSKDYNGKTEFLIDMACFPGSSGSPVMLHRSNYMDKKTGNYVVGASHMYLVGILYAGPLITNRGEIKFGAVPTVEVSAMMHLGQVVRSSQLLILERIVRGQLGWK